MEENYRDTIEGVEDALFGIGASDKMTASAIKKHGGNPTSDMISLVKRAAGERAKNLMQAGALTRTQQLLVSKAGDLDANARQKMASGDFLLQDGDFYLRKAVSGGGTVELLEANATFDNGRSSFQTNRFPDNVNLMCDRIGITYATAGTGVSDVALQKYSADGNRLPVALANAIFILTLDDKPVFTARMSKFFSDSATAMVPNLKSDTFALALTAPKLIKSGVAIGYRVVMPSGVALSGAATHFLEVVLYGAQTGTRTTS